jgi:hypothetical protein
MRGKSCHILLSLLCFSIFAFAQDETKTKKFEIYGFAMMDAGYNFKQIQSDWFDVLRPTKLPAYANQYGTDGNTFFSVRQTRLGFKGWYPTDMGELKTIFEFEMFGTGVDAGQTTIRLRHAYGELGQWGAGQYWSPFMDIDVFPNTVEYWGPNGMVFFRNVQVRWMPIQGDTRMTIALERPGASADLGNYADRIELSHVAPRFQYPDLSAEYRLGQSWGYVELAGILRSIKWDDQAKSDTSDFSGSVTGWGLNLSSNIKAGDDNILRLQAVYGEAIENYFNDAPVDIGAQKNPGNSKTPLTGKALPALGIVAFLDHNWNDKFTSSVGFSMVKITNSDGQAPDAFKQGQYAVGNLLYSPVKSAMMGVEFQWGSRDNYSDGWSTSDTKIQFSFKYNFSQPFY